MNKKQSASGKTTKRAKKKVTANRTANIGTPNPQLRYKDTVFHMLFKEKANLLSLYNAVNGTAYVG